MIHHLALVTTELLPRSDKPCAGGGLRIWGLGESLRRQGIRCTYFLEERLSNSIQSSSDLPVRFYKPELLAQTLREEGCDAALFEQWQPLTFLAQPLDIPVILDMPGPLILEYIWRDPQQVSRHVVDKLNCLSRADYFLCAHPRQLGYYTAWLTWAGISPDEPERLKVVPFTLQEMPFSRQGFVEEEPIFFWGGMFWPWQERFAAFERLAQVLTRYRQGQLLVVGEPGEDESSRRYRAYKDHSYVSWLGRLNFTEFVFELKRATVSVDLCRTTQERLHSSDLRTGTSLWAGIPCIVTPDSAWADLIAQHNAGWVVKYEDEKGQRELFTEIALNRVDIVAKRRGAREISQILCRDDNSAPLVNWLKNPIVRDRRAPFHDIRFQEREILLSDLQRTVDQLRHENFELQRDLNNIRGNPLFKTYKAVIGMLKRRFVI